jgi:hypothetical protein
MQLRWCLYFEMEREVPVESIGVVSDSGVIDIILKFIL